MTVWSLLALGALFGAVLSWSFRRVADVAAARVAARLMLAHFTEFRLFFDEPWLIWRAQKALLAANLRLLAVILPPALLLSLPAWWLFTAAESVYGWQSLPVGAPAIVSARMDAPLTAEDASATLDAPPGIAVETPPMRSEADRRISWRIRPLRPVCGALRFTLRGRTFEKTISAGCRTLFLSPQRTRSLPAFLLRPVEPRLPSSPVAALEIAYPGANVRVAGVALPWFLWFLLASAAGALLAS